MNALTAWIDDRLYPGIKNGWDNDIARAAVLRHLRPEHVVLDLGAGSGNVPQAAFRGLASHVCGIDPSPAVLANPFLDEPAIGGGEAIPFPDAHFDLVFSFNVMEHLPDPEAVFREVHRVLRKGGIFITKTPNRRHYVSLVSRLVPNAMHERIVQRLKGRTEGETFPTFYRGNTPGQLRKMSTGAGLRTTAIELHEGRPEYLRFAPPAYILGAAYERLVRVRMLSRLRAVIVATFEKP